MNGSPASAAPAGAAENPPVPAPLPLLDRVRVVLVSTSHPGNVGSAARAMKVMGLADLVLVTPRFDDIASRPEAVAMAAGANAALEHARIVPSLEAALADCHFALAFTSRRRELSHGAAPLREAAARLVEEITAVPAGRGALVFGSETYGLSNEEVDRCQMVAHIPANPEYRSLNLSQAVQLAAYETMMAAGAYTPAVTAERDAATVADLDAFLQHFYENAVACGFLDPAEPKRFMTRMRRLFTRARLEREEIAILRGVLAAMNKR